MAVVVVLLAIALIVVNAAGIRIHKSAPEAPAVTNLPQFPFSDEPELILGSGQTPSRDAQQAVSVGGEDKTMQLVTGSFAQRGGPDFSLYLDTSVFLSTEMDGKCCFARAMMRAWTPIWRSVITRARTHRRLRVRFSMTTARSQRRSRSVRSSLEI